jgi:hypothetical protein
MPASENEPGPIEFRSLFGTPTNEGRLNRHAKFIWR